MYPCVSCQLHFVGVDADWHCDTICCDSPPTNKREKKGEREGEGSILTLSVSLFASQLPSELHPPGVAHPLLPRVPADVHPTGERRRRSAEQLLHH